MKKTEFEGWFPTVLVVVLLVSAGISAISGTVAIREGKVEFAAWNSVVVLIYSFIAGYITRYIHKEVKE